MVKWLMRKAIGKFERDWDYDASYMHDLIDASPRAAWLFSRAAALGQFRRDLPIEAWCAAGITAVRHEDCGPRRAQDHHRDDARRRTHVPFHRSLLAACSDGRG